MDKKSLDSYFQLDPSKFVMADNDMIKYFQSQFPNTNVMNLIAEYQLLQDKSIHTNKPICPNEFKKLTGLNLEKTPPFKTNTKPLSCRLLSNKENKKNNLSFGSRFQYYPYTCQYIKKEWRKIQGILLDHPIKEVTALTSEYGDIVYDEMPFIHAFFQTFKLSHRPKELKSKQDYFKRKGTPSDSLLDLFMASAISYADWGFAKDMYSDPSLQESTLNFCKILLIKYNNLENIQAA